VRPTSAILLDLADKLGGIANPAEKSKAAFDVLGRGAAGLLPVLNKDLRTTVAELERMGIGMDDIAVRNAKRFDDSLDRIITKLKAVGFELQKGSIEILRVLSPSAFDRPGHGWPLLHRADRRMAKYQPSLGDCTTGRETRLAGNVFIVPP
jgi:hypothetical protein